MLPMCKFWNYMGGFLTILQVSHRKPGTASRAERALFWQGAKPFLHPIARSAAHVMSKIAPIEWLMATLNTGGEVKNSAYFELAFLGFQA